MCDKPKVCPLCQGQGTLGGYDKKACFNCYGAGLLLKTPQPCPACQKPSEQEVLAERSAKAEYEAYARGYADGLKEGEAAKKDRQTLLAEIARIYEIVKRCERPY